jgi:hypothetical protein
MKKRWSTVATVVIVCSVLAGLPVIPVQTAPVVPHRTYTLTVASFISLIGHFGQVGVTYQWGWYTCAVMLAVTGIGVVVGVYAARRLHGVSWP